jgi:hypothetical protein
MGSTEEEETMSTAMTFRTKMQLCPKCGETLDAATKVQGDQGGPEEGDLTACVKCASVLQFGRELKLRVVRLEDLPEDIQGTLKKVVCAINQRNRGAASER